MDLGNGLFHFRRGQSTSGPLGHFWLDQLDSLNLGWAGVGLFDFRCIRCPSVQFARYPGRLTKLSIVLSNKLTGESLGNKVFDF